MWNIFHFETSENKNKASSEASSPRRKQGMHKWDIIHINTALTGFTRVKALRWAWLIFQNRRLSSKCLQHKDDIMTSGAKYLVSDGSTADLRQQTDSTLSWQASCLLWLVWSERLPTCLLWSQTDSVSIFVTEGEGPCYNITTGWSMSTMLNWPPARERPL